MKKIAIVLALMLTTFTMLNAQSDAPKQFPVVSEEGKKSSCANKSKKCDGAKCETKKKCTTKKCETKEKCTAKKCDKK